MSAFPFFDDKRKLSETWMVRLECLGDIPGPRFLDGHTQDGKVALAPNPDDFSGTSWAVTTLAPDVVKFRCMGFAQAPNGKSTPRFLAGSNHEDSVGMRPVLANPPSAEWWRFVELSDGSVTLECLNRHADPNRRFLNGSTGDGRAGLAPNTAPPFTGTRWRVHHQGKLVVMECQGKIPGNKFLDGNSAANVTDLAPMALGRFSGTIWLMQTVSGDTVHLRTMGLLEGNRFLNGHTDTQIVDLAADTSPAGTNWQMDRIADVHDDVELGFLATFKCLGPETGLSFLDGRTDVSPARLSLADHAFTGDPDPLTGTRWRVLPAFPYFEPCPRFTDLHAPPPDGVRVIRTSWVGQLTGKTRLDNQDLINPDTGEFGVPGVDLGANAEAEDGSGRLFIFTGDVVADMRRNGPRIDADMIAFTLDSSVTGSEEHQGGGGINLDIVRDGEFFSPFFVAGPSDIRFTETYEVPSGAYAHNGGMFVFFNVRAEIPRPSRPPVGCYLAVKVDPGVSGTFTEVGHFSPQAGGADCFGGVAPVKIRNADHPWLPEGASDLAEEGLVMFGIGGSNGPALSGYSAVHLAWMPLIDDMPDFSTVRYFTNGTPRWDPTQASAAPLWGKAPNLQSISAAYLEAPKKWIVFHMSADDSKRMSSPVIARIGTPPLDWSEPFNLFDPCREAAYGKYMHWPDLDGIQLGDPFRGPPKTKQEDDPVEFNRELNDLEQQRKDAKPGWAYGAFLLKRYTQWNGDTGELDLYYLLSFGTPYQIQLMHTKLTIPR